MAITIGHLPRIFIEQPSDNFVRDRDCHPWAYVPNTPAAAAVGSVHLMRTTRNTIILVWKSSNPPGTPHELNYYCHGWGLGTYNPTDRSGYTIMSDSCKDVLDDGNLMQFLYGDALTATKSKLLIPDVVKDEHGNKTSITAGDIVAWVGSTSLPSPTNRNVRIPTSVCFHTAIITKVVSNNNLLSLDTKLSSKNGAEPLRSDITLRELMSIYGNYDFEWNGEKMNQYPKVCIYRRKRNIDAKVFPNNDKAAVTLVPGSMLAERVAAAPQPHGTSQGKHEVKSVL